MRRLILDDIMSLMPCASWTRARVIDAMRGRSSVTASDILDAEHVPAQDRIWLLFRGGFLRLDDLVLIAAELAEHVLPLYEAAYPDDQRPRDAILAARMRVLDGPKSYDESIVASASYSAYSAANVAAYVDARYAVADASYAAAAAAEAATSDDYAVVASAANAAANSTYSASTYAIAHSDYADVAAFELSRQLSVIRRYLDAQQEDTQC